MKHAERSSSGSCTSKGFPTCSGSARCRSASPFRAVRVDLAVEHRRARAARRGIALASSKGDDGSREMLADILVDEEEHVDWLETQLETIRQIGVEHYLAQQLHD